MEYLVAQYEMIGEIYSHPESLGKERLMKIKQAFDSYDKDGNGTLERNECLELFRRHWSETGINR